MYERVRIVSLPGSPPWKFDHAQMASPASVAINKGRKTSTAELKKCLCKMPFARVCAAVRQGG